MKSSYSDSNSSAPGKLLSKKAQQQIKGGNAGCGGCYVAYANCGSGIISYVCCPGGASCDCEEPC